MFILGVGRFVDLPVENRFLWGLFEILGSKDRHYYPVSVESCGRRSAWQWSEERVLDLSLVGTFWFLSSEEVTKVKVG